MDAAQALRNRMADGAALRLHRSRDAALGEAITGVTTLQGTGSAAPMRTLWARPHSACGAVHSASAVHDAACTDRDVQWGRIAGTLQTLFPRRW